MTPDQALDEAARRSVRQVHDLVDQSDDGPAVAAAETNAPGGVRRALRSIAEMTELPSNWDGYGAAPPAARAVAEAAVLIEAVGQASLQRLGERVAPWTSSPIADGGLQLEWSGRGGRIEVQLGPDGAIGYLIEHGSGENPGYEEVEDAPVDAVVECVVRVLAA